jgi:hypothetical protein
MQIKKCKELRGRASRSAQEHSDMTDMTGPCGTIPSQAALQRTDGRTRRSAMRKIATRW